MKKIIIFVLCILCVGAGIIFFRNTDKKIHTPNGTYTALVVGTEEERTQGLSSSESLPAGTVMFFVFETPDNYGFWMKDMLYPLDIVFLDTDMKVISYTDNASPASYPTIFYPESPAQYVLEMHAGEREKAQLYKGVKVYYK